MKAINSPLFCITSDVDWASDYAIRDFLTLVSGFGIRPTIFATHASPVLTEFEQRGAIELGIHPNFLPRSTHGDDVPSVIERLCGEFPHARSFRSHGFVDHTEITRELYRRGFRYDSNLCLFLQPDLVPLRHQSGLVRFPVFWEDDVHFANTDGNWRLDDYLADFTTPGLKVFNFHPFLVAANVPNQAYYTQVKQHTKTLGPDTIDEVRYAGSGLRTFLIELLETLTRRGERLYTLGELHQMLPLDKPIALEDKTAGRTTVHSDAEYQAYWKMSEQARQEFVKQDFQQRSAKDPYATSRDYNARELEIESLRSQLREKGTVLDLGCGNGYTLLSLARTLPDWDLCGVDFSENLIDGARALLAERKAELKSRPQFVVGDAVAYLHQRAADSVDYLITERFVQNLPSQEAQRDVIRHAYRVLAPGGRLLFCEGSDDGFESLNELRALVGLARIPATSKDNVSSIRIKEKEIEDFAAGVGFKLGDKIGYSNYFLVARVLHPLLVAPQSPRFDARINDLARLIQQHTPYQPGYGSNVLWVFEKR
jgi:SAM-dependent methyltransferase